MNEKQKADIRKQYAKGKDKYILQNTILVVIVVAITKVVIEGFSGDIVTITPGFPMRISVHLDFIIGFITTLIIWPFFGYFMVKRQWNRVETNYQKILDEEQDREEGVYDEKLRKTPLYLRNLE